MIISRSILLTTARRTIFQRGVRGALFRHTGTNTPDTILQEAAGTCLPDSPKPDSPKIRVRLGFRRIDYKTVAVVKA